MNETYEALKRRHTETHDEYRRAVRANHRPRSTEETRRALHKALEAYRASTARFHAATALRDAVAALKGFGIAWQDLIDDQS